MKMGTVTKREREIFKRMKVLESEIALAKGEKYNNKYVIIIIYCNKKKEKDVNKGKIIKAIPSNKKKALHQQIFLHKLLNE